MKVKKEHIEQMLAEAEVQKFIAWDKVVILEARLKNGFTIGGRGACVDPAEFDEKIGEQVAWKNIEHQLWQLEGYLLQEEIYRKDNF